MLVNNFLKLKDNLIAKKFFPISKKNTVGTYCIKISENHEQLVRNIQKC